MSDPAPRPSPRAAQRSRPAGPDGEGLARLLDHQRARWERGERPPVEDYLRGQPALRDDPEAVLDLVYNEVMLREAAGEAPQLGDYLERFPALAGQVADLFEVHSALQSGDGFWPHVTVPAAAGAPPAVPGCEVVRELGRGGMGVVYLV
jgi:hypothetical protein